MRCFSRSPRLKLIKDMQFCWPINHLYLLVLMCKPAVSTLLILTFSVFEVGWILDFAQFGFLFIQNFVQFRILSNSRFCPFGILSNSEFYSFGILFFGILSFRNFVFWNFVHDPSTVPHRCDISLKRVVLPQAQRRGYGPSEFVIRIGVV